MHLFVSLRLLKGTFSSMFSNLRVDEDKFFIYLIDKLIVKLIGKIKLEDTFLSKKLKKSKKSAIKHSLTATMCVSLHNDANKNHRIIILH